MQRIIDGIQDWLIHRLAEPSVVLDFLSYVFRVPDGSWSGLVEQLFIDWIHLDFVPRAVIASLVLCFLTALLWETIRYGRLMGRRNMIHLAPISVRGPMAEQIGSKAIALSLQAQLNSVVETSRIIFGRDPAPYLTPATGSGTGFHLVGTRQERFPRQPSLRVVRDIPTIEQEISIEFGNVLLPVSKLVNLVINLLGAVFIPFRGRYRSSSIRVTIVSTETEATVTAYCPETYVGNQPEWWKLPALLWILSIPKRTARIIRPPFSTQGSTSTPPGKSRTGLLFTVTKEISTLSDFNDIMRDTAFMVLRLHGQFEGRHWQSMRHLFDGLAALNEYRNSGRPEDSHRAKVLFKEATAVNPDSDSAVEALYFHGMMTMVDRTAESIDEARRFFERALSSDHPQLRALTQSGLAYCYAQQAHRLGIEPEEVMKRAELHARHSEWEWRFSESLDADISDHEFCHQLYFSLKEGAYADSEGFSRSKEDISWGGPLSQLEKLLAKMPWKGEMPRGRLLGQKLRRARNQLKALGIFVAIPKPWSRKEDQLSIRMGKPTRTPRCHPLIPYTYAMVSMVNEKDEVDAGLSRNMRLLRGALLSRRAADLEPDNGLFFNNVGWALMKLVEYGSAEVSKAVLEGIQDPTEGSWDGGLPQWEENLDWSFAALPDLIDEHPEAEGHGLREVAALSERYFKHSLSLNEKNKLVHANLCFLYAEGFSLEKRNTKKETKEAVQFRRKSIYHGLKALELDPFYINAFRDLAAVSIRFKDFAGALGYYRKALELAEAPEKDRAVQDYIMREISYLSPEDREEHSDEIQEFNALDPRVFLPRTSLWMPRGMLSDLRNVTLLPNEKRLATVMVREFLDELPCAAMVVFGEGEEAETLARRADRVAGLADQRVVLWALRLQDIIHTLVIRNPHPTWEGSLRRARGCVISQGGKVSGLFKRSDPIPTLHQLGLAFSRAEGM